MTTICSCGIYSRYSHVFVDSHCTTMFDRGFSTKERVTLAKRLAFLVRAGVPIVQGLYILKKQAGSKSKILLLEKVIADVSSGQFLSSSFAKFKNIFDQFAINIIKIGEESGRLDQNLEYLAEELQKKQLLKRKIRSALMYPFFILIATLGITGLIIFFVFPKILPIFKSLNLALPLTTKMLIFINDFGVNYGLYVVLLLVLLVVLFLIMMRQRVFRFFVHRILLRLPLFGTIFKSYHMANFCRTLGLLLKSDVRIVKAFSIAGDTTSNLVYRQELVNISKDINKGVKIVDSMERHPHLFPSMLSQMLSIGETTGRLDETFIYLSELYENELDDTTKNLSTILEPALMIFMGVVVGFIAISIIAPIYAVTQNLNP